MEKLKPDRRKTTQSSSLFRELRNYEKAGTHLYLEGHPSGAGEIVHACMIAEQSDYMRDIISDDKERITRIDFIRVADPT